MFLIPIFMTRGEGGVTSEKKVIIVNGSFIHGGGVPWQQQLCNPIGDQLLSLASAIT